MKANLYWKILVLGAVLASAAACSGGDSSSSATTSTTTTGSTASADSKTVGSNAPVEIAFLTNNASDYWTIAHKGTDKAVEETPGLKVDFVIPPNGTAAEQKENVDEMISKGVQGIAMSPVDPANETDLINDAAKKVLVFTQDSDATKSNRACYVGSDNVAAGNQLGQEILKALPNGGKIMAFVGKKDAQNAADRIKGVEDALKGSKVQLVDVRTDETDRAKAKSNVSDALVANPDLAGLIGIWSYNGPAILSAVKDAGKVGKVKILCFDEEDDTLAGVKDGSIQCTIVQNPYEFGKEAMEIMAKYLRGDKSAIPASKTVYIPTRVIDKSTVDAFKADLMEKKKK
jgi:ribose transport system substrate-binding protein